jgi:hypothetical protein
MNEAQKKQQTGEEEIWKRHTGFAFSLETYLVEEHLEWHQDVHFRQRTNQ